MASNTMPAIQGSLTRGRVLIGLVFGVVIQVSALYIHLDYLGVVMGVIFLVGGLWKARTKPGQMQVVGAGLGMLSTEAVAVVLVLLKVL